jgi:hypothetical protein
MLFRPLPAEGKRYIPVDLLIPLLTCICEKVWSICGQPAYHAEQRLITGDATFYLD